MDPLRYYIQAVHEHCNIHKNALFVCFSNILLRRQKISGLTPHKPIIESVAVAVKELIHLSKSTTHRYIPEARLQSLTKIIGVFSTSLPDSLLDMKQFRYHILSMMKKFCSPSLFLALSSTESMWLETFVEISNGRISVEQAKYLSGSERAALVA